MSYDATYGWLPPYLAPRDEDECEEDCRESPSWEPGEECPYHEGSYICAKCYDCTPDVESYVVGTDDDDEEISERWCLSCIQDMERLITQARERTALV